MVDSGEIIVNAPAADWLTLTTYSEFDKETMFAAARSVGNGRVRAGRWLQYEGERGDDYFIGQGEQLGSGHYAMWVSGSAANDAARLFRELAPADKDDTLRCTRFDVQLTCERKRAKSPNLLALGVALRRLLPDQWPRGARPGVTFWSSDQGDTLYLGDRKSDWMLRIYDKPIDDRAFIRFENEYKAARARSLWRAYIERGDQALAAALSAEWAGLPQTARAALDVFRDIIEAAEPARPSAIKERSTMQRRLAWLARSAACLEELLSDEACGFEAERIMLDCIRRANRI